MYVINGKVESVHARPQADVPVGWGAAVIDEQGNEVPITESMIERACEELARSWSFPRQHNTQVFSR